MPKDILVKGLSAELQEQLRRDAKNADFPEKIYASLKLCLKQLLPLGPGNKPTSSEETRVQVRKVNTEIHKLTKWYWFPSSKGMIGAHYRLGCQYRAGNCGTMSIITGVFLKNANPNLIVAFIDFPFFNHTLLRYRSKDSNVWHYLDFWAEKYYSLQNIDKAFIIDDRSEIDPGKELFNKIEEIPNLIPRDKKIRLMKAQEIDQSFVEECLSSQKYFSDQRCCVRFFKSPVAQLAAGALIGSLGLSAICNLVVKR